MTELYEFASPAWLKATCELFEKWLVDADVSLSGVTYKSGEQFNRGNGRTE